MADRAAKSRKQAAEASRLKLLHAGLELLAERLPSPVEQVRSTEVAERGGYTAGAFYHHWPSQDAFREELRAMVGGATEIAADVERVAADFAGAGDDVVDGLRAACRAEVTAQAQSPSWRVQLAMIASSSRADLDCSAEQYRLWSQAMAQLYQGLLDALDLQLRPGLTMDWFARAVMALGEGFTMQRRSGVEEPQLEGDWQAYETAVAGLILGVAVRRDGRPVDGETLAERLGSLSA